MKDTLKSVLNTSIYFLCVLICVFLIITFVGQRIEVVGESMSPTLSDGDFLLVDKLSYRFKDPGRFDIIVFPYKFENNTNFIKRVVGLPGESIFIDETGKIYINGEILNEGYGKDIIENSGRAYEEIILGEDEYFVLGDNRNNSMDSRDPNIGNIKRQEIVGKALIRVFPFDKMGMIRHR